MAISIDPETGLKIFDTRASKSSEKIRGHGYEVNPNLALKTLPETSSSATFDAVESNSIPNVPQSHLPVLVLAARTPALAI